MSKIYPNLTEQMLEDNNGYVPKPQRHSSMETNCGQIFSKSSAIRREIMEKLEEAENIGPKNITVCGQEFKSKELWIIAGLLLLFLSSLMGTGLMFGTGMFDEYVLSKMTISPESKSYKIWKGPYASTFMKVYIFNYTNVDEYERGDEETLHVNEVGPYVYEEWTTKVNIKFNPNGTITYQEKRDHKFRPDLSKGCKQSDRVIVPNMPMLGAAAASEHSYYFSRLAMSTLLSGLNSKPFLNVPAHRFIWGYDDNFYALAKGVMSYQGKMPLEKVGLLTTRNGTSDDIITVNTGHKDIDKLGQIDNFNGKTRMNHWSTEDCDSINGNADGMFFPPHAVRQKKPIYTYFKDLCRRFGYVFDKEVSILNGKVAAYRYVLPESMYDSPETNPENQCYCDLDSGNCPAQGLFNTTACGFGVPLFVSLPHFYKADPSMYAYLSGLKPNDREHNSYMDVHPTMGFTIAGITRLQTNIQVKKSFGMSQLDMFKDDVILPITWIEAGLENKDLPDDVKENIYGVSLTVPRIEMSLKCVCGITTFVTLTGLVIVLRGKLGQRARKLRRDANNGHDNFDYSEDGGDIEIARS